ncbi:hypothetical protein A5742_17485 [Mycolicibacterium fortuitum]|uniref:Sporulation regulator WhiA C-terminal domain-containing protein n=2 Tax=Mycolicibacterium fortuitum TaxID=1766 RepID=A0ABD6QT45_MYCFO|nr:hypothetical protein A5742_17485 [Mycolicibacterium fortuitum]
MSTGDASESSTSVGASGKRAIRRLERRQRSLLMYREYEAGATIAEIAEKYRLTPNAVTGRFRVLGLSVTDANTVRSEKGSSRQCAAAQQALRTTTAAKWRAVLKLRVQYPDLTLADLAAKHDPPLTKDAYWSRLRRALRAAGGEAGAKGSTKRPQVGSKPRTARVLSPAAVASQDETAVVRAEAG